MKRFISCDWGTSVFRLRLIEATSKDILAENKSPQGIAATYTLWKQQTVADKIYFYGDFILQQIRLLETQYGHSLDDVPVVISGMASSSIGMVDLPYKNIPYKINETQFETHVLKSSKNFRHDVLIISGVRSQNDVMRGEETILAGCNVDEQIENQLFIFPGTHSKHVIVEKGVIKDFKTYVTGELFDLLKTKSVLSASVEEDEMPTHDNEFFIKGLTEILSSHLLNSIFHVRTNELFNSLSKKENYHYLSGLLIGEELKNIAGENFVSIVVVATGALLMLYTKALLALGFKEKLRQQNSDFALINGQAIIFNRYKNYLL